MIETGILFAGILAVIKGIQSVYQRKNAVTTDEFVTAWSSRFFGIPVLLAAIVYYGVPELSTEFFLLLIPQSLVIALTSILIAKAFKASEASLVTPMFAFSPILVILPSFLIFGEIPSINGLAGIFLIALGAYSLKLDGLGDPLAPLKNLWKERGVQIIMVVVAIYAVTANTDKLGVQMSSPVFWPLAVYTLSTLFMYPVMRRKSPDWKSKVRSEWKHLAILGASGGIAIIFQMTAIQMTLVSYVIAIKRLSIPVAVVMSYFMLKEADFKKRLIGSVIMVAGAILIAL